MSINSDELDEINIFLRWVSEDETLWGHVDPEVVRTIIKAYSVDDPSKPLALANMLARWCDPAWLPWSDMLDNRRASAGQALTKLYHHAMVEAGVGDEAATTVAGSLAREKKDRDMYDA